MEIINIIQIIAVALMGRLWASDEFEVLVKIPFINKTINLKKPLSCFIAGLFFLPNIQMAIVVFLGLWIGNVKRDSIFGLLSLPLRQCPSEALKMTLKAFSFIFLTVGVYYLTRGTALSLHVACIFLPMLSRAPVQFLCRYFWFVPENAQNQPTKFGRFFLGKAELYELLWSGVIGYSIILIGG
jgi:hypothetical protein